MSASFSVGAGRRPAPSHRGRLKWREFLTSSLAPRHSSGTGLTEGGLLAAVCLKHRGGEGRLLTLSFVLSPRAFSRKAFLGRIFFLAG